MLELANLVSGLPEHHRNAVVLRCVQGMTYAEAASVLPCFVVQLIQRAIKTIPANAGRISSVGKARGRNKATMT